MAVGWRVWAPVSGVLAALLLIVLVNERTRVDMAEATRARRHTLEVQHALERVLVTLLDAETGQRGFLMTADPAYRAPYERARVAVATSFDALRALTGTTPQEQERIASLDRTIVEKMRELQETIDLFLEGNRDAAMAVVRTNRGRQAMDRIREVIDQALRSENERLAARDLAVRSALLHTALVTYSMLAVIVFTLGRTTYLQFRLKRLEPLLTLCAWSKTVRLGDEWVSFEEYLRRQFGISVTHGISPRELAKFDPQQPRTASD